MQEGAAQAIVDRLAGPGWGVFPDFIDKAALLELRQASLLLRAEGRFHRAGVGRGAAASLREEIRGDEVCWIEPGNPGGVTDRVLHDLEAVRQTINGSLFLGLFDAELHFAVYPPGARYARHRDRFRDDDKRALTVILYLNEDWQASDGGQLRFWPEDRDPPMEITPHGGTLVTFLADRFWHEVLPANRTRHSLTGWFRTR